MLPGFPPVLVPSPALDAGGDRVRPIRGCLAALSTSGA